MGLLPLTRLSSDLDELSSCSLINSPNYPISSTKSSSDHLDMSSGDQLLLNGGVSTSRGISRG